MNVQDRNLLQKFKYNLLCFNSLFFQRIFLNFFFFLKKKQNNIQAFYYGRIEARKLRLQLRESWDNQSKTILQNIKNKREMALSLITFVRKFLFFYQLHHDNDRKKLLSNILLQKSFGNYVTPFIFLKKTFY